MFTVYFVVVNFYGVSPKCQAHVTRKIDEQPLAPFLPTPESHRKSSLELLNAQVFRPPSTTNSRRKYRHHAKRSRTQYVCTYSEFRISTNLRRARALAGTFYAKEKVSRSRGGLLRQWNGLAGLGDLEMLEVNANIYFFRTLCQVCTPTIRNEHLRWKRRKEHRMEESKSSARHRRYDDRI